MNKTLKKIILILFIALLAFEFVYFVFISPRRLNEISQELYHKIEYRNGSSPLDMKGNPLWIYSNRKDTNWIGNTTGLGEWYNFKSDVQWDNLYWSRILIEPSQWNDPAIFLLAKSDVVLLFFQNQLLTNWIGKETKGNRLGWIIYPLPKITNSTYLYFHHPRTYQYKNNRLLVYASHSLYQSHLYTAEIIPLAAGLLFLVTGMLALLLAFGKYRNPAVIGFALLSLLVGVFTIAGTNVAMTVFNIDFLFHCFFVTMLFLTPAAVYFIEVVFEQQCSSIIHKLWIINLSMSFLFLSLYIIDFNLFMPWIMLVYAILTPVTLVLSTAVILRIPKKNQERVLFTIGFFVFVIFSLGDLINSFLPTRVEMDLFWGMLWLVIIIGKILVGQFNRAQDQLQEYSQNLESMVEERTDELQHANEELGTTLNQLQTMQKKIIQQEKLASLGGLTAGIAHEIKNPLNFVNNFASVSLELLEELKENIEQKSLNEDDRELISDLEQSITKINDHGRRADGIVQSMLLHSRGTAGEFKKVDLNSILLEYANLAYHGMRAQDINFQVDLDVDLDPGIKEVIIVPQDISRAFLNIVNNACYAANDKRKTKGDDFEARVTITSRRLDQGVEITIRDNGSGIPPAMQDSIFDPFFTTKPAGDGTGLGLSISYDIIVNEHRGQLELDTKDGEYTQFRLWLPNLDISGQLKS